jgi:hypothetical protein
MEKQGEGKNSGGKKRGERHKIERKERRKIYAIKRVIQEEDQCEGE